MVRMPVPPPVTALAVALVATVVLGGCGSAGSWPPSGVGGTRSAAAAPTSGRTPSWGPAVSASPATSPVSTRSIPTATPTPTARPTATPKATVTPTPTPRAANPTPTAKPRTTLVRGDSGPRVRELQERLSALGYWLGTPDGSFGSLTRQAVLALQKAAGIRRDGVVGPDTTRALAAGIRPSATIAGDGVEIVLSSQLLLVVRGGDVRTILNTSTGNGEEYTTTSGGRGVATTPRGRFTVYRAVDGQVTNSLGELWRPIFFHRGFAVHGSPSVPPWPASHGCARLSNAAVDMVWAGELMPIGSRVLVR